MIQIKINGKKTFVQKYKELTVSKYRELILHIPETGTISYVRYIAITCGLDEFQLMNSRISKRSLGLLNTCLGDFIYCNPSGTENIKGTFEDEKPTLIFKYEKNWYDFKKFKMNAAGYRVMYEQYIREKRNSMDVYTFFVAMLIDSNFDYENVIDIQKKLENYNAYKVFSLGAFFFKKWRRGAIRGYNFSRMLTKVLSIGIRTKKNKLELIGYRSTRSLVR